MGQARQRGTFEHRKWLAIEKKRKENETRKLAQFKREAAMTDEQRLNRHSNRVLLSVALANMLTLSR